MGDHMTAVFRASAPVAETGPDLGPLVELPGTWIGTGFSLISRPDKHDAKPFFLEVNATRESLGFTQIGAPIPTGAPARTTSSSLACTISSRSVTR